MKENDPGLWPTILIFSPAVSYLAWTQGLGGILLVFSAAFVLLGAYVCATGRPSSWRKHAPYILLSGLIQFVLIVPMTGLVANQQIGQMAGYSNSIAGSLASTDVPW